MDFPDYDESLGKFPIGKYHTNGPRVHEFINEMNREVFSKYQCMTVGEAPSITVKMPVYCGYDRKELDIFTFDHMNVDSKMSSPCGKWELKNLILLS